MISMLTLYSQRDARWSKNRIGLSWLTLGTQGCVSTDLAMLSTYVGHPMTPAQVAANKTWFFLGMILWWMVRIPNLKFLRREFGFHPDNIVEAIKGDPNIFVLIQIKNKKIKEHWLWGIGVIDGGRSFRVADPLYGDECDLVARYGSSITGAAYWKKI